MHFSTAVSFIIGIATCNAYYQYQANVPNGANVPSSPGLHPASPFRRAAIRPRAVLPPSFRVRTFPVGADITWFR